MPGLEQPFLANHERSVGQIAALEIAESEFHALGYELSYRCVGGTLKTYLCEVSVGGEIVDSGIGKGLGEQSKSSAVFEALEHIHLGLDAERSRLPQRPLDLSGRDKLIAEGSPCLSRYETLPKTPLSLVRFKEMCGDCEIDYPIFLVNPEFDLPETEKRALRKTGLPRYSSNSGMASGAAYGDALLHGLLEVIERDAIGIELIRCIFSRTPSAFRLVSKYSLPSHLLELVSHVEAEFESAVDLFDISTDTKIPAFLSRICASGRNRGIYFGSGASLNAVYAAERAVLEAVQSIHFHDLYDQDRPDPANIAVGKLPTYMKCWMEAGILACDGNSVDVDFPHTSPADRGFSVSDQIARIIRNLNDIGIRAYERSISRSGISVVQVLAPALERFFLVGDGVFVTPGSRGQQFL